MLVLKKPCFKWLRHVYFKEPCFLGSKRDQHHSLPEMGLLLPQHAARVGCPQPHRLWKRGATEANGVAVV